MPRDPAAAPNPNSPIMQTALLSLLSLPQDKAARDGSFLPARRAAAYREVLIDPDVIRVAGLVDREEAVSL